MAGSNAVRSHGTILALGDGGSPESFTTVAEVKNITGPNLDRSIIDVTNHQSNSKEKIGGLRDSGQVTFNVNLIPTDATQGLSSGLLGAYAVDEIAHNFQITFPDNAGTTWTFAAIVKGFHVSAPVDGVLDAQITLDVTGLPELA